MFTGIIEKTGEIKKIEKQSGVWTIQVAVSGFTDDVRVGDSISVNGVCLTVVGLDSHGFQVQVVEQTRKVTTFESLFVGEAVNLEKALTLSRKIDGHLVQGHVDGIGAISEIQKNLDNFIFTINTTEDLHCYFVEKGSVTVDGVSLTIQSLREQSFDLAIIPHTYQVTNLCHKKVGDPCNLEIDLFGKYIWQYLKKMNLKPSTN